MRIFYVLVILLLTSYANAFSQTVKISGLVKTKKDSALAGATVVIKGTTTSVVADNNGAFLIKKIKLPAVLVFSADGCKTKEFDLKKNDTSRYLSITLLVVSEELAEYRLAEAKERKRKAELRAKSDRLLAKMKSSPAPAQKAVTFASTHGKIEDLETLDQTRNNAGVMTAGELSDFKKWKLWDGYNNNEFKVWSQFWGIKPVNRYCVQVQNKDYKAIVGEKVCLVNTSTHDTAWNAISDNTGKAELWANFNAADSSKGSYAIICGKEALHSPVTFENGINQITLKTSCAHSDIADIAFVVDATGSMGDEINYLKNELTDVIKNAADKNKDVKLYTGAVFYRDSLDDYLTRYIDFQKESAPLMQFINDQSAGGGNDFPEAVDAALATALDSMHWHSDARAKIIFLILDAPPHEDAKDKIQQLMKRSAAMGVRIVPIVCSGIDKSTEYIMRSLALATNGSYVFLTDDSGIGDEHMLPTTDDFKVELLNDLLQRVIAEMVYMSACNKEKPVGPGTTNNHAKVVVYPNPSQGRIQIKTNEVIKELYLTDFTGKMLEKLDASLKTQVWQIDLSKYPSGAYLIRYFTEQKGWGTTKVLLMK